MPALRVCLPALFALAGLALWAARAPALAAQDSPLAVEVRGGAAFPVGSFRTGLDSGGQLARAPTFGLHLLYRGGSGWGPYVGFSQHRFDCAADGCPLDEYVLTSWDVGIRRTVGRHVWLRAGFVAGRAERYLVAGWLAPTEEAAAHAVSLLSLGAEVGAGLRLGIGGRIGLSPAVRYGWLNTRYREGGRVRMRWLAVGLGVALGF